MHYAYLPVKNVHYNHKCNRYLPGPDSLLLDIYERDSGNYRREKMKIRELLSLESINIHAAPANKEQAISDAVDLMVKSGKINNRNAYLKAVKLREGEGSTGVGGGIAIPHGRDAAVSKPGLAAMVIPNGVDYESLDGQPVDLLFLIAAPEDGELHLAVLAKLARMLMDPKLAKDLTSAASPEQFLQILDKAEIEADAREAAENGTPSGDAKAPLIVGVTSCPTGIAHTYMAAESLEKKAQEMGYRVKIETRGSGGAKNVLTPQEIEEAAAIIVAADAQVPMARFDGHRVVQAPVKDGINKAEQLITQGVSGSAPVYHSDKAADDSSSSTETGWHKVYKDLMNGVSHMLPFVVGGGIMIAISFLIDGMLVDVNSLSFDERALFGTITPAAAFFKNVGGVAFGFMLPVLAGFIAESIADRPGLAVGFVGGAIAANGTSGFLGALAAGFIAGYLVNLLKKICSYLPDSLEGIKPVLLYPFLGILIIGALMVFCIEPPLGALNTMLNNWLNSMNGTSSVILGALLGAMMAFDMGGPLNKAAYVFGTASIAAGNYDIMAAVMVGGMVPPLAIALATFFFKDKFTPEERKTGPTNLVMGFSFITEGAIPFAASDPLHIIPCCMAGSALAGALSMLFHCTLMAPHGGIFVLMTIGNPWMYLIALIAGSALGCVLLGLIRPKKTN